MKEIEILVQVFSPKDHVLDQLKKFDFVGEKKTLDQYFYDPLRQELKPDDAGHLKSCFRLRTKADKSYLTYKIDHFDDNHVWTYSDEHEIEVSNSNDAQEIITHLGLVPLVTIDNLKSTFISPKYEIVLEEVKDLGLFLEVENLDSEDSRSPNEIKNDIQKFINQLDIKVSPECIYGKPELMLRK